MSLVCFFLEIDFLSRWILILSSVGIGCPVPDLWEQVAVGFPVPVLSELPQSNAHDVL